MIQGELRCNCVQVATARAKDTVETVCNTFTTDFASLTCSDLNTLKSHCSVVAVFNNWLSTDARAKLMANPSAPTSRIITAHGVAADWVFQNWELILGSWEKVWNAMINISKDVAPDLATHVKDWNEGEIRSQMLDNRHHGKISGFVRAWTNLFEV